MNSWLKKISGFAMTFALAGVLSLGIAGCGGGEDVEDDTPEPTIEEEMEAKRRMLPPGADISEEELRERVMEEREQRGVDD